MGKMIGTYVDYLKEHYIGGTFGSISAVGISYLDLNVKEVYEMLLEVLRFIILLFGAVTAILAFYGRYIKKVKTKKNKKK